jgi:hypothetical protein
MFTITALSNRVQQLAIAQAQIAPELAQGQGIVACGGTEAGALCASKWYFDVSLAQTSWKWLGIAVNHDLSEHEKQLQLAIAAAFEQMAVKRSSSQQIWPLSKHLPWREVESFLRDQNHIPSVQFASDTPSEWASQMWTQWLKSIEIQLWQKRVSLLFVEKIPEWRKLASNGGAGLVPRLFIWRRIFELLGADPLLQYWGLGQLHLKAIDEQWVVVGIEKQGKKTTLNDFLPGSWERQQLDSLPFLLPEELKAEQACKIVAEVYGN